MSERALIRRKMVAEMYFDVWCVLARSHSLVLIHTSHTSLLSLAVALFRRFSFCMLRNAQWVNFGSVLMRMSSRITSIFGIFETDFQEFSMWNFNSIAHCIYCIGILRNAIEWKIHQCTGYGAFSIQLKWKWFDNWMKLLRLKKFK